MERYLSNSIHNYSISGVTSIWTTLYRLGLLALSLALGEIVQEPVTVPSKMFPPEFQDFLRRCLDRDERERWSSKELLEHKGGRGM